MQPGTKFVLGILIVITGFAIGLALLSADPALLSSRQSEIAPNDAGPWPECAACLADLRENMGDPKSLEIVKWESRKEETHGAMLPQGGWDKRGPQKKHVHIVLKYRGRTDYGGVAVDRRAFHFEDGKLAYAMQLAH